MVSIYVDYNLPPFNDSVDSSKTIKPKRVMIILGNDERNPSTVQPSH